MPASCYRTFSAFEINTRFIDGEWLLFHAGTGHTHLLNGTVGDVFSHIKCSAVPVDIENIKSSVAGLSDADEIMKILESLLVLHLIERVV